MSLFFILLPTFSTSLHLHPSTTSYPHFKVNMFYFFKIYRRHAVIRISILKQFSHLQYNIHKMVLFHRHYKRNWNTSSSRKTTWSNSQELDLLGILGSSKRQGTTDSVCPAWTPLSWRGLSVLPLWLGGNISRPREWTMLSLIDNDNVKK